MDTRELSALIAASSGIYIFGEPGGGSPGGDGPAGIAWPLPVFPGTPGSSSNPFAPTNPQDPTDPLLPTDPFAPADPWFPTDPPSPTDPWFPTDPSLPSDPSLPNEARVEWARIAKVWKDITQHYDLIEDLGMVAVSDERGRGPNDTLH